MESACAVPEPEGSKVLSVNPVSATLEVGKTLQLTASLQDVNWITADGNIATVTDKGLVEVVGAGSVVISATAEGQFATCELTVVGSSGGDGSVQISDKDNGQTPEGVGKLSLVWNDEFDGNSLDESKWGYQFGVRDVYGTATGPSWWGNREKQYYTKDAVTVSDGTLKITAQKLKEPLEKCHYTSARILTRDKFSWTYGYFEAKMKTPAIQGMWPAFWMLPQPIQPNSPKNEYGGWASSGEIDIMEARGRLGNVVNSTLHYGGGWPKNKHKTHETTLSSSTEEWHIYGLEWRKDFISWYIDGQKVFTLTSDQWYSQSAPDGNSSAPFDKDFFITLNLAVGGTFDRNVLPDEDFVSATMEVDYVRVYAFND